MNAYVLKTAGFEPFFRLDYIMNDLHDELHELGLPRER